MTPRQRRDILRRFVAGKSIQEIWNLAAIKMRPIPAERIESVIREELIRLKLLILTVARPDLAGHLRRAPKRARRKA